MSSGDTQNLPAVDGPGVDFRARLRACRSDLTSGWRSPRSPSSFLAP